MSDQPTLFDAGSAPAARELVLASAGSGKTYRISSRIIELLAAGESPQSILASTFTRKAAGEILERVLLRLARAATIEEEAAELAEHALPADRRTEAGCGYWKGVLTRTVADLHRLNIGTLDAFFMQTVRTYSHDLGLPPSWGIADEPTAERVRAEALDELLVRRDTHELIEILRSLHSGSVRRSVHDALAKVIDNILRVHLALVPNAPGWGAMRQAVGASSGDLYARAQVVAERVERADVPFKKDGISPDGRWAKAAGALATALRDRDWESVARGGLGGKVLEAGEDGTPMYYRSEFPGDLLAATRDALAIAREALGLEFARRAEAMAELASSYDEAFRGALIAARVLRFEDVTRMLLAETPLGSRADLFYRLDATTRHLLLDEFQDTSITQWQALQPLVDRLVGRPGGPSGDEGAAIVVADPKQSIYGWRGAAPIVVDAFGNRYDLPRQAMAKSWRSSQVVLDAVNRVFENLDQAPAFAQDPADADVVREWCGAFTPHEAAHEDYPGHVLVQAGPALEGTRNRQPALSRYAAEQIAVLHRKMPNRSIGVLTRTNDEVGQLIYRLGELDVPASEEGGTTLLDSAAVVSALALLRLVDHPGDGLARYHVAMTPVGEAEGLADPTNDAEVADVTVRWRRQLLENGYGETLSALAERLRDAMNERDRSRLRRLVELGYAWDASQTGPGLRVDDFVRRAESERAESPGEDPVRVMTVHGSKGLEFDIVVLPQLHAAMMRSQDYAPVGYRPVGIGDVTHAFPYIGKPLLPLFADIPELTEAVKQRRAGQVRDALGTLYVGMTRARYALHMIVPSDRDGKVSKAVSPARVLRETLAGLTPDDVVGEGDVLYEHGDPDWATRLPEARPPRLSARAPAPETIRLRTGTPRTRGLERRTPSGPGPDEPVDVKWLLRIDRPEGALLRGSVVHAWLETLDWGEEGLAPEPELRAIAARVAPDWTPGQVDSALSWLRESLGSPEIKRALSRSSWPDGTTVERELPFLIRDGDALIEGFVDRLVLIPGPDGEIQQAMILDYKTDRLGEDAGRDAVRMRHYRGQLGTYGQAVRELYGLTADRVRGALLFLREGGGC